MAADRLRIPTPQPATPESVAGVVAEIARPLRHRGPWGAPSPAVVRTASSDTAANIDRTWIGTDADALFEQQAASVVFNDADAAGLAETEFGAGEGRKGTVVMVTLGTGIGSAVFVDGVLVPNTELGHLEIHGGTPRTVPPSRSVRMTT